MKVCSRRYPTAFGGLFLGLVLFAGYGCGEAQVSEVAVVEVAVEPELNPAVAPNPAGEAIEHTYTHLTSPFTVDRLYASMMGPSHQDEIRIAPAGSKKVVWITGYHSQVVAEDGWTPLSTEFMCHTNLDFHIFSLPSRVGATKSGPERLFTQDQGQSSFDFLEGFGLPVNGVLPLILTTQILNLNNPDIDTIVRQKVTIDYIKESERTRPIKPLFQRMLYALKALDEDDRYYGIEDAKESEHGPGCLPGQNAGGRIIVDKLLQRFTGHWVLAPGREVNRTNVTRILALPFDTTVHFISVHVHPFAVSLELADLTTGETVFKSMVKQMEGRIGIESVEPYADKNGVMLYQDHEYELISIYDNTSDRDFSAMAVMYLYLHDTSLAATAE